ncbi:MAG: hypothetical protein ACI9C1_000438 [Candidatus Aldehydirespiratoraceae bacterium]
MPLSDDEQRILTEIEDHLYESDPALAREVAQTTIYTHAFRNLKWASAGFTAGAATMVMLLSASFILAFVGFLLMLGSLLWFESNARKLGRAGLEQMTENFRGGGLRDAMGGAGSKMRERFQRPDEFE